ncbi:MAG TPA: hypothetical protein DCY13_21335 [Verrucomicrobiales bacterium]|nr:hypothetical protein [Verrucomicrobiales bacterium]
MSVAQSFAPGERVFAADDYDLGATLSSGQAFRWRQTGTAWEGVVGGHVVRLEKVPGGISARATDPGDWQWLVEYLQLEVRLAEIIGTFPDDEPMKAAVAACRGLRLLRQDPWECLASFILSSTKQITQIRQIVDRLCARFGEPLANPDQASGEAAFPAAGRIAVLSEAELRACGMGFRAPYLLQAARRVADSPAWLEQIRSLELSEARARLTELPGVGRKIADCVLLFAGGHPRAFPVDVWILRALRELYFRRRRPSPRKVLAFSETHFGPNGGFAQQYLFHYMRLQARRNSSASANAV